jgi:hypothetical protein
MFTQEEVTRKIQSSNIYHSGLWHGFQVNSTAEADLEAPHHLFFAQSKAGQLGISEHGARYVIVIDSLSGACQRLLRRELALLRSSVPTAN